jgi:5'-3' exonuclease
MPIIRKFSELLEESLFDFGEETKTVMKTTGTVLIVDFHNLMFRTAFGTLAGSPEDNEDFYLTRHNILEGLFYHINNIKPKHVIIAIDAKNSWRYEVYPEYKANRKDKASKINIEQLYPIMDIFLADMKAFFTNIAFLKLPRTEADDIIGVMCKKAFSSQTPIVILSSDSDMHQLLNLTNVKQYDPRTKEYVKCINAKATLECKIISGDSSDNIKGIRPRVGPVTAAKIVTQGLLTYLKDIPDAERKIIREKYILNKTLIDFNCIPKDIEKNILNTYAEYDYSPIKREVVMPFFVKHKMVKHMEEWGSRSAAMKLIEGAYK